MMYLFNSEGKHIVNELNGQLYIPTGQNIGHYLDTLGFFVNLKGYYLGEIVLGNRFLYRTDNVYKNICYGDYGNYGNVGNFGNPGVSGSVGQVPGFSDIDESKFNLIV